MEHLATEKPNISLKSWQRPKQGTKLILDLCLAPHECLGTKKQHILLFTDENLFNFLFLGAQVTILISAGGCYHSVDLLDVFSFSVVIWNAVTILSTEKIIASWRTFPTGSV